MNTKKLLVSFFGQYESEAETSMIKPGITYEHTSNLKYGISATFFDGPPEGYMFENKDSVNAFIKYQF